MVKGKIEMNLEMVISINYKFEGQYICSNTVDQIRNKI